MTAYELKAKLEATHAERRFFSRENMKFAGDTMANFGVRSVEVEALQYVDEKPTTVRLSAWELYRKRAVKSGRDSFYFSKTDFRRLYGVKELEHG